MCSRDVESTGFDEIATGSGFVSPVRARSIGVDLRHVLLPGVRNESGTSNVRAFLVRDRAEEPARRVALAAGHDT